ncbi:MAG: SpoIIE family protein phosphatase, partial [Proteobacteria bacterium]|nr:SpoIIE family protein phosphatase [Pseudomonadota bacterium]
TWAIIFLEMEQKSNRLIHDIYTDLNSQGSGAESSSMVLIFELDEKSKLRPIQGSVNASIDIADLGFKTDELFNHAPIYTVIEFQGENFFFQKNGSLVRLIRIHARMFHKNFLKKNTNEATVYIASREEKLIYSNDQNISSARFSARPLVQKFIDAPFTQGQFDFKSSNNEEMLGFFYEVPDSNLVIFAEMKEAEVLSSVYELRNRLLILVALVLLFTLAILYFPISMITFPLKNLVRAASQLGRGDFGIQVGESGFGEVAVLSDAFSIMAKNLGDRDELVQNLNLERIQNIRTASELKIAKSIQSNLLPSEAIPISTKLDIKGHYLPATECSGDWYHYFYNESAQETIVVVADVSGHGAGSSIFTAIIAAVFERYKIEFQSPWPISKLLDELNLTILRMGRQEWHASLLLGRYRHQDHELDLYCAGHVPPYVSLVGADGTLIKRRISMPSSLLGLEKKPNFCFKTLSFPTGSCLFLYTDGFTEAKNPEGKMLKPKKLEHLIGGFAGQKAQHIVESLLQYWNHHRSGVPAADDLCIVVMVAL